MCVCMYAYIHICLYMGVQTYIYIYVCMGYVGLPRIRISGFGLGFCVEYGHWARERLCRALGFINRVLRC